MTIKPRTLISLAAVTVLVFLVANITGGSHDHPGTTSNVFWVATIICFIALVALTLIALVQRIIRRAT